MKYDLAIIGGGPAGLMAALQASEAGFKVLLLEKNARLGIKLLITGGGRCNLSNHILDYRLMANSYGKSAKFLLSAFSRFGVLETIEFFESRGVKLKVEEAGRILPQSDRAQDILNVFVGGIKEAGGEIITGARVDKIMARDGLIEKIILENEEEIFANNFLISTGGLSYPETGSSGDGYKWLKELGHQIVPLHPVLTRIAVKEKFVLELEGLSFASPSLSLYKKDKKIASETGDFIFTRDALSGPAARNLSSFVEPENIADLNLAIDFCPEFTADALDKKLTDILAANNKFVKNSLEQIIPPRLIDVLLKRAGVSPDKKSNGISRQERQEISSLLKKFTLSIKSLGGYDIAMVTGGGVSLREIDPKTMHSKLIKNLFLAGEVLDIDGPTGGYNLQAAWSTGYAAGKSLAD